jgi:hypothetical protein
MLANNTATVVIKPERTLLRLGLMELWEYRELLYFLAWRERRCIDAPEHGAVRSGASRLG